MNKISDLKRLGECKTALDIGFKCSIYEDDGSGILSGYNIDIYYSNTFEKYVYMEYNEVDSTSDIEITHIIECEFFGDFVDMVHKHLNIKEV